MVYPVQEAGCTGASLALRMGVLIFVQDILRLDKAVEEMCVDHHHPKQEAISDHR